MNQANVEALRTILDEVFDRYELHSNWAIQGIAEALASCGVLVPSALTNKQADSVVRSGIYSVYDVDPISPDKVRSALARIAKGETP